MRHYQIITEKNEKLTFCFLPMTIESESGRSDMERALRLMILYHPCKFESYILATF